jgi:hypothetical protein
VTKQCIKKSSSAFIATLAREDNMIRQVFGNIAVRCYEPLTGVLLSSGFAAVRSCDVPA